MFNYFVRLLKIFCVFKLLSTKIFSNKNFLSWGIFAGSKAFVVEIIFFMFLPKCLVNYHYPVLLSRYIAISMTRQSKTSPTL